MVLSIQLLILQSFSMYCNVKRVPLLWEVYCLKKKKTERVCFCKRIRRVISIQDLQKKIQRPCPFKKIVWLPYSVVLSVLTTKAISVIKNFIFNAQNAYSWTNFFKQTDFFSEFEITDTAEWSRLTRIFSTLNFDLEFSIGQRRTNERIYLERFRSGSYWNIIFSAM